jgi:hypothetical protein
VNGVCIIDGVPSDVFSCGGTATYDGGTVTWQPDGQGGFISNGADCVPAPTVVAGVKGVLGR